MFFGKKSRVVAPNDKVWKTSDAKFQGICAEIADGAAPGGVVIAIAHFEQSADAFKRALDRRQLRYREVTTRLGPDDVIPDADQDGAKTFVVLSELLSSGEPGPVPVVDREPAPLRFIVIERYPLRATDDAVVAFAQSVPYRCTLTFHVALDEPLLRMFGAASISAITERLGWDGTKPIEGKAIPRAISVAQEQIKAKAIANQHVPSADDWFRYNLPPAVGGRSG